MATYNPLDTSKKKFDPYEAVKTIADYKTGWHSSYNAGDKAKADEYANKAQEYYKQLRDNGYSDVADALTNTNDVGAKYIVENFIKNNSAPTTTEAPKPDTTTITGKVNDLYGIQKSDREKMAGKYDTLEDYNYSHNPYESEIGKSIMEDYKFKGKTASDNAVASGGADNGGNIDSYAAANANRQQLAFTNAGKQAVLNDFNTRITHAKDILNNLGVYQQNQDKGMHTTIGLHQTEEQRVFENDETEKNNRVDRDVKTSEVTGYVPESMSYSDNPFFNKDGTLINPDTTDYSQIITNAKNKLKTATDSAEKANLEATIKYATQARAYKILNMPEYSKWASTMELTSPDATITSNKELNNKAIEDKKIELTQAEIEANERNNQRDNSTKLEITNRELQAKMAEAEQDKTWTEELKDYDLSDNAKTVLNAYAHEAWQNGEKINILEVLSNNADTLTPLDATEIMRMYGIKDSDIAEEYNDEKLTKAEWLKKYTWYNPDENGYTPE